MRSTRFARGLLAGAVGLSALAIAGTAAVVTPNAAAAASCVTPANIDTLTRGQALHGLTVAPALDDPSADGVTPSAFTGTVIGVAHNAIQPGYDVVMVEIHSDEIDKVGGIWAGMSGSPMYTASGELVGATAWTLTDNTSFVVGVTPYAQMDDHLSDSSSARATIHNKALAHRVAEAAGVSVAKASTGFKPMFQGATVSGVSPSVIKRFKKFGLPYVKGQQAARAGSVGSGASARAGAADIVPGGNLGAFYTYGDISFGGVGTVTAVCGDQLLAFGHPMDLFGDTNGYLMAADALYIQSGTALTTPFKMTNLGDVVGRLTGDHLREIQGTVGDLPDSGVVTNTATFTAKNGATHTRTGTTNVALPVVLPDIYASATLYENYYNVSDVADYAGAGTVDQDWTIKGTDHGKAFKLSSGDLYTSGYAMEESAYAPADFAYALGSIEGVDITSVKTTAAVNTDTTTYSISSVTAKVGGGWTTVNRKHPIIAKPGVLRLRVTLTGSDDSTKTVPATITIPKSAKKMVGALSVIGGGETYTDVYDIDSIAEARTALKRSVPHTAIQLQAYLFSGGKGGEGAGNSGEDYMTGEDISAGAGRARNVMVSSVNGDAGHVVYGGRNIAIVVR